jgi:predicted acylesterase/phospholipase RssA
LQALERLGVLSQVDVVSSVSGGSVFTAGWLASLQQGEKTETFIEGMQGELRKGFILRTLLKFPWLLCLLPGYPRTNMLAKVFTGLSRGLTLQDIKKGPLFVMNTTVLNSGQVGKFIREGFSTPGLGKRSDTGENPTAPCGTFPLALAAAASAAFPVGLPPVLFRKKAWFPDVETGGPLKGHATLALTDGGVLENLGTQTLLKSRRFSTTDIIASDAGTRDVPWRPSNPVFWLRSFVIWLASGSILERFTATMNDKQNRWMREILFDTATQHSQREQLPRRNVLLVRVAAEWDEVVGRVARSRLEELKGSEVPTKVNSESVRAVLKRLPERSRILEEAFAVHKDVGFTIKQLNGIGTNFTGLSHAKLEALRKHAYWQTLATFAIYWEPWPQWLSTKS